MKRFLIYSCFCALLIGFIPISSDAAVLKIDSDVKLKELENINENLFVVSGGTEIHSSVVGDVTAVTADGIISGDVYGDLLIFANDINISGNVYGDVRVVGKNITIEGNVSGDVTVIGDNIIIREDAEIGNDLLILGKNVSLYGILSGNLHTLTNYLYINNKIPNEGNITTQNLSLGPKAEIAGNVMYYAPQKAQLDVNSKVTGNFSYNQIHSLQNSAFVKRAVLQFISFWMVLRLITTLVLAFILIHVFKFFSQRVTDFVLTSPLKSLGIGLLVLICVPILSLILFVSLFAMPIGILMMLAYFFIIILSPAVASIFVGVFVRKVADKQNTNQITFPNAFIGALVLATLQFVPYVGEFLRFLITIIAIGGVAHYIHLNIRWRGIK